MTISNPSGCAIGKKYFYAPDFSAGDFDIYQPGGSALVVQSDKITNITDANFAYCFSNVEFAKVVDEYIEWECSFNTSFIVGGFGVKLDSIFDFGYTDLSTFNGNSNNWYTLAGISQMNDGGIQKVAIGTWNDNTGQWITQTPYRPEYYNATVILNIRFTIIDISGVKYPHVTIDASVAGTSDQIDEDVTVINLTSAKKWGFFNSSVSGSAPISLSCTKWYEVGSSVGLPSNCVGSLSAAASVDDSEGVGYLNAKFTDESTLV